MSSEVRLIDADELKQSALGLGEDVVCDDCTCEFINLIDAQPTIDAVPVVHGHWVWDEDGIDWNIGAWKCSRCRCRNRNIHESKDTIPLRWAGSKYCPQCGAKMDEVTT